MSTVLVYLQEPTNVAYLVVVISLVAILIILNKKQSEKAIEEEEEAIEEEEEDDDSQDDIKEEDIAKCGDNDEDVSGDKQKFLDMKNKHWMQGPKAYNQSKADQRKFSHTQKVKPWRVGGHQTQICPKGAKKGFRG